MDFLVGTYIAYLVISIGLTIWVAQTLSKNGKIFLKACFNGHTELANSVNHLLVVGFYLINLGYVSLMLKHGQMIETLHSSIEILSGKIGTILLILGFMHFLNLFVFFLCNQFQRNANKTTTPNEVNAFS